MEKQNKKFFWFNIVLLSLLTAALIVCGFYDLEISKALFRIKNFGWFFSGIADFPISIGLIFSFAILYAYFPLEKSKVLILKALSVVGILIGCILFWIKIQTYYGLVTVLFKYFTPVLFASVSAAAIILLSKLLKADFVKKMLIFAIYTIALILIVRFFAGVIKLLWQRLRFMNIDQNTFAGFTPWWLPQFTTSGRQHLVVGSYYKNETFMSFVSGSTAAAGNLFAIIMLPEIFKKLKKLSPLLYIVPMLYCLLVSISRVIIGAHYITDVIASIILSYFLALILKNVCLTQKFKKFANFCINLFYKEKTEHLPLT
ncbi:MAG: phosphatase PAP2 family protein [Clostridia bacterium]|nr:phosphatase PAP2 family protein [Clostridia bacterium]